MKHFQLLKQSFAATLAGISIAQLLAMSSISPAHAAYFCQCVEYAKAASGIPSSTAVGNAKDMIYSLPNLGFNRVNAQVGAVAVMQTSFPGLTEGGKTYGHVGIVSQVYQSGGRTYIVLRGANQGGSGTEGNCNNVNNWNISTPIDGRGDISFWARTSNNSSSSSIRTVSFTGTTSQYSTNVRSAPSSSANYLGSIKANSRLSFDAWTYGTTEKDLWTGQPDRRWYRIAGTNTWVASATINGNAPGSTP
jgi:CHAP domain